MRRSFGKRSLEKDVKTSRVLSGLTSPTVRACRVYNDAAFTVGNAAWTAITFNSERSDTFAMHSTSSNTSRITFAVAGWYLCGGHVSWTANATGVREVSLRLGGTTYLAVQSGLNIGASLLLRQSVTTLYYFAATNYIELCGYQSSGGDLDIVAAGDYTPEFWAVKVG